MLELAKSGIKPVSGCLNPVRWDDDDDDDADDDDDDDDDAAAGGGGGDDDNGWIFNPKRGILNIYIVSVHSKLFLNKTEEFLDYKHRCCQH